MDGVLPTVGSTVGVLFFFGFFAYAFEFERINHKSAFTDAGLLYEMGFLTLGVFGLAIWCYVGLAVDNTISITAAILIGLGLCFALSGMYFAIRSRVLRRNHLGKD